MNWEKLYTDFQNPGVEVRPLQIMHSLNSYVERSNSLNEEGTAVGRAATEMGERDWSGLDRVFAQLKEGGAGGVVTNVGWGPGYLRNPKQWELLRYGLRQVRDLGMISWIYDEEGYPSGAAGGVVLEGHPEFEARAIACEHRLVDGPTDVLIQAPVSMSRFVSAIALPVEDGRPNRTQSMDLSACVDDTGTLQCTLPSGRWRVLFFFEKYTYEGTHAAGNVWAFRRYINVLEPDAVRRFIEVTHEAYLRELGPDFGGARAFFTDEPSLMTMYVPSLPSRYDGKIPVQDPQRHTERHPMVGWSRQFTAEFTLRKGYDILTHLSDLFIEVDEASAQVRSDYREVVSQLFAESFIDQIGTWCSAHGIESSGHVLAEENLLSHIEWLGADLFALMKGMSIPGIDMLDSNPESILSGDGFMTPKQVSSAAHMAGRKRVMSESSDWVQGNEGRKASLDEVLGTTNLQYLLGVNILTLYYNWKGMGEDYPVFTTYTGRLGAMLTAGRHDSDVAVLYPLRSIVSRYLPTGGVSTCEDQPKEVQTVVKGWTDTCRFLLTHQVDFDCMDEDSLGQAQIADGAVDTGFETYRTVVIPPTYQVSVPALEALKRLVGSGGRLVIVGDLDTEWKRELLANGPSVQFVPGGIPELAQVIGTTIQPTVKLALPQPEVLSTRHRLPDAMLYFVINNSAVPRRVSVRFDNSGVCRQWDPRLGEVCERGNYLAGEELSVDLASYGGQFFTFDITD